MGGAWCVSLRSIRGYSSIHSVDVSESQALCQAEGHDEKHRRHSSCSQNLNSSKDATKQADNQKKRKKNKKETKPSALC